MKNKKQLIAWMHEHTGNYFNPAMTGMAYDTGVGEHGSDASLEFSFSGALCAASGLGRFLPVHVSEDPPFDSSGEDMYFRLHDGEAADMFVPGKVLRKFGFRSGGAVEGIGEEMLHAGVVNMEQAIEFVKEKL